MPFFFAYLKELNLFKRAVGKKKLKLPLQGWTVSIIPSFHGFAITCDAFGGGFLCVTQGPG